MKGMKVLTLLTVLGVSVALSGCNNAHQTVGSVLGGLAGGYGGSQIGDGKGRLIATGVGSLLGLVGGGYVGSFMDNVNQNSQSISDLRYQQMKMKNDRKSQFIVPMGNSSHQGFYNHPHHMSHSPYSCSVRNNYIVCNSN